MFKNNQFKLQRDIVSPTEIKKLKFSNYKDFALKICLVVTLLFVTAKFSVDFIHQQKLQNLSTTASNNLNTIHALISNNLEFMENQVQQFVSDSELHRYLITQNNVSKEFILNSWLTIAERLKWFSKIELFSFSGINNLAIEYDPLLEQAFVIDQAPIEKKQFQSYNGDIEDDQKLTISTIDLNKAFNEPSYPLTPIINISSKITLVGNRSEGIINVSVLADKLLLPITQIGSNSSSKIMLVNHQGFYLKGEQSEHEWGQYLQASQQYNFAEAFPDKWQIIQELSQGTFTSGNNTYVFKKFSIEPNKPASTYVLINRISHDFAYSLVAEQIYQLLLFHLAVLILSAIALWYSHNIKLTRKIQQHSLELISVLFNANDAIVITDDHWNLTSANKIFTTLTQLKTTEILGKNVNNIINLTKKKRLLDEIKLAVNEHAFWRGELDIVNANHDNIPCLLSIAPVINSENITSHYVMHVIDITQQKAIENELKLAAVALETKAGILIAGGDGLIQRVNSSFTEITGYAAEDVIGNNPNMLSSGRHSKEFYTKIWSEIITFGFWEGEIWNKRKSGEIFPEWITITTLKDKNDKIKNIVATFYDITARKKLEKRLESLANTDPLTGCLNRRSFEDRFNEQLSTAKRYHQGFGLIMFDIDHFKLVNDNFGHDRGDEILVQLAQHAKQTLREADILARWGGEEFMVLLPISNINETLITAERLRSSFKAIMSTPNITCSFGVTHYQPTDDITKMVKRADLALYKAKESGRDKVILANDPL